MTLFAEVAKVGVGSKLKTDAGFTCLPDGVEVVVGNKIIKGRNNLYVPCDCGKHFLDGQISFPSQGAIPHYVGFYLVN